MASAPPKAFATSRTAANDPRAGFSPANWAHQALLNMDEAEALVRWASVSILDVAQYNRSAEAFWAVVHLLGAERNRLEPLLRAVPRRRASRRRVTFQRVR